MRLLLLFLSFLAATSLSLSQQTTVEGIVRGAEGQTIRLLAADDFISQKTIVLAKSRIDGEGHFALSCEIKETMLAFLNINVQRAEIYLEAGKDYRLEILYRPGEQLKSYFDREPINYEIINSTDDDLNNVIARFNNLYGQFVIDHFNQIYVIRDRALVTEFRQTTDSIFDGIEDPYFKNIVKYKFAGLEQLARIKSHSTIANEYFAGEPVLYNNAEYTFYFSEFFGQLLFTSPRLISLPDLLIAVNEQTDLATLDEALMKSDYLYNPRLRELVLLLNLRDMYAHASFDNEAVLKLIRQTGNNSPFPEHQKIATNMINEINELMPGTPAPNLKLTSIGGYEFQIKELRSKPVLLMFFQSGQRITKTYFDELTEIYNKFRAGLELISISMDDDPDMYLPLANSGQYPWSFAHYGNRPEVYDLYNIKDLPLFVLIDVEGNIASYPAPPPGEALERSIMKVIH